MLAHTDLKKGTKFIHQNQPHEVLESKFLFKGRGGSVLQAKIKSLISGQILSKTFHPDEEFEKAEMEKIKIKFLYARPHTKLAPTPKLDVRGAGVEASQGEFWFCKTDNPANRFSLPESIIGKSSQFLKPNTILEGLVFQDKIINVSLPIKVQLKVAEAPPGVKGDRAQGGTKTATLETGAKIAVPLFIEEGDIIEVNTENGEYVRRIGKE